MNILNYNSNEIIVCIEFGLAQTEEYGRFEWLVRDALYWSSKHIMSKHLLAVHSSQLSTGITHFQTILLIIYL